MKSIAFILLASLSSLTGFSQEITGHWNGILKIPGTELRLVLNISKTGSGYSSTMDSPDQGAKGIPVTSTTFANSIFKFEIASLSVKYEGVLGKDDLIVGNFKQGSYSSPLNLTKGKVEKTKLIRPQEPALPYPYHSEDVFFENNAAKITLAGTLTLPKKEGHFPAVILISGSGPQNRDEEVMGHKPFLVISDYLTRNGIAVLRFDDRGTALSKGNFSTATSLEFSTDVEAAVKYIQSRKEIDKNKIGLIGHSEGGMIAPLVASRSKEISFIILLAGPGIPGDKLLLMQNELIGKAEGLSDEVLKKSNIINKGAYDIAKKSTNMEVLKTDLNAFFKEALKDSVLSNKPTSMNQNDFIKFHVSQIANPWMIYFLNYNPALALAKVKCPVLALNGEKDLQVPAKENLQAIKMALTKGGNKNVTVKELPGLNHLFQECKTGSPGGYATIEQTFAPTALAEISNWVQTQTK
jgi:hypothetical protein